MMTQPFPTEQQLDAMYADVFGNEDVRRITLWTEPNCATKMDEEVYLNKALTEGPEIADRLLGIIEAI